MQNFNRTSFISALIILWSLISLTAPTAGANPININWLSYDEGVALAKKEGKKIFLHFYNTHCGWCTKMKNGPFKDNKIVNYLNTNFVSIKVNNRKRMDLTRLFSANAVPNNWFISEKGERIANVPGFIPTPQFFKIISYIKTDSYKQISFDKYPTPQ